MRMKFIVALGYVLASMPAAALEVGDIHSTSIKNGEHISIPLSETVQTDVYLGDGTPPRVIIDMPDAEWKSDNSNFSSVLVRAVKLGSRSGNASRMTISLADTVKLRHVHLSPGKRRGCYLEFDMVALHKISTPAPAAAEPRKEDSKEDSKKNAQFRPLGKPVIVIDPGHGGQDPGTSGVAGMKEKRVTLRFAETLRDTLMKSGRYKVVLTRNDDRYLFLRDRVKIAREAHGSLFISLHADSAPTRSARGLSVYTISEKASDKESEALAAKENKADVIGGMDLSGTSPDVADILIELAERETRGKSAQFAKLVTHYLGREVHLLSNTHRYAGFAVLKAPDIPSILVEVGFLTSPQEEKQLESDSYRMKVAHGLALAVDSYFARRK